MIPTTAKSSANLRWVYRDQSNASKASHAARTPSSCRTCSPTSIARREYAGSSSISPEFGHQPSRSDAMAEDRAGDSEPGQSQGVVGLVVGEGTTSMGRPDRIASPLVPIPPAWTTTAALGNNFRVRNVVQTITPSGREAGRER